jgi:SPP1 gp7 family putative phage head morphogenesis protein
MMKFDLRAMFMRRSNRRRTIVVRAIYPTLAQAGDLALIYLRVTKAIEARLPRLLAIYEKTLAQKLRTDSIDEMGVEINELDAELDRLVLELTPDLRRWAMRTERWHRGKWQRAVLDAVNITIETMLGEEEVRETIEAFLQRNVALVRNVSDEARGKIADSIFRGFNQRATAAEMAKEIREATAMARKRAIRIAGDQTVKLASALDAERQRQAGFEEWAWQHSGKKHPREHHKARDGKIYDLETNKAVDGSETIPRDDTPGVPPFCGCVRRAVLTFD